MLYRIFFKIIRRLEVGENEATVEIEVDSTAEVPDCYEVLNLPRTASKEEIRSKWAELVRENQPKSDQDTDANDRLRMVNLAYGVLKDAGKKAALDQAIAESEIVDISDSKLDTPIKFIILDIEKIEFVNQISDFFLRAMRLHKSKDITNEEFEAIKKTIREKHFLLLQKQILTASEKFHLPERLNLQRKLEAGELELGQYGILIEKLSSREAEFSRS